MRILKFLLTPMKYLMFLVMFCALIYYRSVIFHANVNQYIDWAVVKIEDEFRIEIPAHTPEVDIEEISLVINRHATTLPDEPSEELVAEIDKTLTELELSTEEGNTETEMSDESVQLEEAVYEDQVIAEDKSVTDIKTITQAEVDTDAEKIAADKLVKEKLTELETNIKTNLEKEMARLENKFNLIEGLSQAMEAMNKKVDKLFDVEKKAATNQTIPVIKNEILEQPEEKEQQIPSSKQPAFDKEQNSAVQVLVNTQDKQSINKVQAGDLNKDLLSQSTNGDSKEIKRMARESFWNGDTQLSEKFYLNLTQFEDTDPDVYGELGNVYYAQGKWKQAGQAYYEAAIRLLELKQTNQVVYLLRVIQGLDTESAEKLRHKMSG